MSLAKRLLVALVCVLWPLAALGQANVPSKPDFAPMTYFVGLWHCKFLKNPDPKLLGVTFSFAGRTDPSGYWETLELRDGRIYITRDRPADRWTFIYLGNGGDYSVMTTPGWVGKTLTLKEVMTYGDAPRGVAQFVRRSDTQYSGSYSAQAGSGRETYETACSRV